MHGVVKIHGLDAIYYLPELPDKGDDWEIEEGAWVEVGPDVEDDSTESDRSASWTLAISKADSKHYRLFKYPEGVENTGFEPTGRSYGGGLFSVDVGAFGRGHPLDEGVRGDRGQRSPWRHGRGDALHPGGSLNRGADLHF